MSVARQWVVTVAAKTIGAQTVGSGLIPLGPPNTRPPRLTHQIPSTLSLKVPLFLL